MAEPPESAVPPETPGTPGTPETRVTQASARAAAPRGALVAHPVTSVVIGLLLAVAIAGTLVVPIYARVTPRVGDFPFFYFYLLAYTPLAAIATGIAALLQRRVTR